MSTIKRRPTNLTIREDILREAKDLKLNTSKAAESGILNAINALKSQKWLAENQAALNAHNERIAKQGTLLKPDWASE